MSYNTKIPKNVKEIILMRPDVRLTKYKSEKYIEAAEVHAPMNDKINLRSCPLVMINEKHVFLVKQTLL